MKFIEQLRNSMNLSDYDVEILQTLWKIKNEPRKLQVVINKNNSSSSFNAIVFIVKNDELINISHTITCLINADYQRQGCNLRYRYKKIESIRGSGHHFALMHTIYTKLTKYKKIKDDVALFTAVYCNSPVSV